MDRVAALEGFYREWKDDHEVLLAKLSDLAALAGRPFQELVDDVSAWCRRVKDERHNIAHYKGRSAHQSSGAILFTAEAAYWLFVFCMLRVMQAPSAVFEHIVRCPQFEWVKEGFVSTS